MRSMSAGSQNTVSGVGGLFHRQRDALLAGHCLEPLDGLRHDRADVDEAALDARHLGLAGRKVEQVVDQRVQRRQPPLGACDELGLVGRKRSGVAVGQRHEQAFGDAHRGAQLVRRDAQELRLVAIEVGQQLVGLRVLDGDGAVRGDRLEVRHVLVGEPWPGAPYARSTPSGPVRPTIDTLSIDAMPSSLHELRVPHARVAVHVVDVDHAVAQRVLVERGLRVLLGHLVSIRLAQAPARGELDLRPDAVDQADGRGAAAEHARRRFDDPIEDVRDLERRGHVAHAVVEAAQLALAPAQPVSRWSCSSTPSRSRPP